MKIGKTPDTIKKETRFKFDGPMSDRYMKLSHKIDAISKNIINMDNLSSENNTTLMWQGLGMTE